jgi:hypothetical protein
MPTMVVQKKEKRALTTMEDAHNSRQTACSAEEVNGTRNGLVVGQRRSNSAADSMIGKCVKV